MSGTTIWFGIALILLGVASYVLTGHQHPTSLIPAIFGILLAVFGNLARTPDAGRRKLYMHVAVTIGLVGFLAAVATLFMGNPAVHPAAVEEKATMAILLLIFVLLCVRSFVTARRGRV